jgi:hypothetical protein
MHGAASLRRPFAQGCQIAGAETQSHACVRRGQPACACPAVHRGPGDSKVECRRACVYDGIRRSRWSRLYLEARCWSYLDWWWRSKAQLHLPPVPKARPRLERPTKTCDGTRGDNDAAKSNNASRHKVNPGLMGRHPDGLRPQQRADGLPGDVERCARRRLAQFRRPDRPDTRKCDQAEGRKPQPKQQLQSCWATTEARQPTAERRDAQHQEKPS